MSVRVLVCTKGTLETTDGRRPHDGLKIVVVPDPERLHDIETGCLLFRYGSVRRDCRGFQQGREYVLDVAVYPRVANHIDRAFIRIAEFVRGSRCAESPPSLLWGSLHLIPVIFATPNVNAGCHNLHLRHSPQSTIVFLNCKILQPCTSHQRTWRRTLTRRRRLELWNRLTVPIQDRTKFQWRIMPAYPRLFRDGHLVPVNPVRPWIPPRQGLK